MERRKIIIFSIIIILIGVVLYLSYQNKTDMNTADFPNDQIASLEAEVRNDPDDIEAWQQLALQYNFIGDYRRVGEIHQSLIELDPTNNIHRLNLGSALLDAGRIEDAAIAYLAVLELNKKEMNAYPPLIDIYSDLGKDDQLRELITPLKEIEVDSINIGGEDRNAIILLARIYKALGENENAIEYYQKMIDLELGNEEIIKKQIEELR